MKNIEKYYDAIKHKLQTTDVLNLYCTVNEIRTGCDDCPEGRNCRECCLKNLEWLNNENIITDEEKMSLKALCDAINKFGFTVNYVIKHDNDCNSYIRINCENIVSGRSETIYSPYFTNDKFKGMEPCKEYTLEELGITCPTQKDS